jgi:adenosine deaminase
MVRDGVNIAVPSPRSMLLKPRAIRKLPKADLHSHIDGSVPPKELFRIAKAHKRKVLAPNGAELGTVTAFMEYVVGKGYGSMLDNIVDRFRPITGLMQTEEIIHDVGVSYVRALKDEGVAYAEGRFAPQYHTGEGLSMKDVIVSMAEGVAEGAEKYDVETALIVAIGREATPETGFQVARAASSGGLVVALDLAGPEAGNPPRKFRRAFGVAAAAGLKATVHAGEGAGSLNQNLSNIEEAITLLGADRIGHAIPLARSEHLLDLVLRKSIAIEMNPVSNLVLHNIRSLKELGIERLLARGATISVNSDDPALWPRGGLSEVYSRVCAEYGFRFEEFDRLVQNSFDGAFVTASGKRRLQDLYRDARRRNES